MTLITDPVVIQLTFDQIADSDLIWVHSMSANKSRRVPAGALRQAILANYAPAWSAISGKPANLTALEGLTLANNKGLYATGAGALSVYDLTAFGRSLNGATAAADARTLLELGTIAQSALGDFLATVTRGAANGVCPLDASTLIPTAYLPPLALTVPNVVASQAAMLALTAERGDFAIRTDNGKTYVLSSNDPTTLADWKEITATGTIISVNGQTGIVSLAVADITGLTTALAGKSDTGHTHAYGDLSGLPTLFSGAYDDLSGKPTLFSGAYADLSGKPTLFSGAYADLSGKPTLGTASAEDVGHFVLAAARGAANGVASLDGDGLVPTSQLPALAITDTFEAASEAAMLALSAEKGDVAIRTDENRTYILTTNSPSTLADWKWMRTPTDLVLSVAGLTGTVSAAALKAALAIAASDVSGLAAVATSGDYGDLINKPTLGTAAALNVGTGASQVVQLNGSGQLPAVSGANVTNVDALTVGGKARTTFVSCERSSATGIGGSVNIDFSTTAGILEWTLSSGLTITTSNLTASRQPLVLILNNSTGGAIGLTLPAWIFLGAVGPTTIAAGKVGVLSLTPRGTTDATMLAAYSVQP